MITIEEYNEAELAATETAPDLHAANRWGPVPVENPAIWRVVDVPSLQFILNRFHWSRFRGFMYELGGLSRSDLAMFIRAKNLLIEMQREHYPQLSPTVPLDTLLCTLLVYRKIKTARPAVKSILEIGPGSGLTSLYFSQDPAITHYTQIEATQATYLCQAMVNDKVYGSNVWEMALPPQTPKKPVWHVPWWRVDDLYDLPICYDVITANACLNEISDPIVADYLRLFDAKSHAGTLLLIQDLGAWFFRNKDQFMQMIATAGWHLIAQVLDKDIIKAGAAVEGDCMSTYWFTKCASDHVDKLTPRSADGSVIVSADYKSFSYPGDETVWHDAKLADL